MSKRLTAEEFIRRARVVHGDRYDYSKANYVNNATKVTITCKRHGDFLQQPSQHMLGHGCPICGHMESHRRKVYGIGINDACEPYDMKSYNVWKGILNRTQDKKLLLKRPTYLGCKICNDWIYFSRFLEWYKEKIKWFHKGWHLDKDLLSCGEKVYSPETCCFVPNEINAIFKRRGKKRDGLPEGICYYKKYKKYVSYLCIRGRNKTLGYFDNIGDALRVRNIAKEKYIQEMANKYKELLEPRVYDALMNYKIEITD